MSNMFEKKRNMLFVRLKINNNKNNSYEKKIKGNEIDNFMLTIYINVTEELNLYTS